MKARDLATKISMISDGYRSVCAKLRCFGERHLNVGLYLVGTIALSLGTSNIAAAQWLPLPGSNGGWFPWGGANFDPTQLKLAVCNLLMLVEGPYGAVLMTTAGIGAIAGAAFGKYSAAYQALAVGVGSFILRSMVSLWFGTDFGGCAPGGGVRAPILGG